MHRINLAKEPRKGGTGQYQQHKKTRRTHQISREIALASQSGTAMKSDDWLGSDRSNGRFTYRCVRIRSIAWALFFFKHYNRQFLVNYRE